MGRPSPAPPQDIESEKVVLGSCLIAPDAFGKVVNVITAEDMHAPRHRMIFEAMRTLYRQSHPLEYGSVARELDRVGAAEDTGGSSYLLDLTEGVSSAANVSHYAGLVRVKAQLRALAQITANAAMLAYEPDAEPAGIMANTVAELQTLQSRGSLEFARSIDDHNAEFFDDLNNVDERRRNAIKTGFYDLDRLLGPIERGWLLYLTGRPSHGKTLAAMTMADYITANIGHVIFFSLEMAIRVMVARYLAPKANHSARVLRQGPQSQIDFQQVARAINAMSQRQHKLWMWEQAASLAKVESETRRIMAITGKVPAMVIIDRLEFVDDVSKRPHQMSEYDALTRASGELLNMGKRLNVPILCLVQLNRNCEDRANKRPVAADLRGSGAMEQDARIVMTVYRDEVYYDDSPDVGILELGVVKNNEGELGTTRVMFDKSHPWLRNLEESRPDEWASV